jgi:nitrite reductase/ring-hydroxylating ferredoxin subunit
MKPVAVKEWSELADRVPVHALVANVDLVVVRVDDAVSVLYGRCAHRGALMADGYVDGDNLICGVHYWDYRLDSGVSEYRNSETLAKFTGWVEDGHVLVDEDEIGAWATKHPQPYNRGPERCCHRGRCGK